MPNSRRKTPPSSKRTTRQALVFSFSMCIRTTLWPSETSMRARRSSLADLFDIEGAEAEAATLPPAARHLHFQELECAEEMEHGAVVYGAGLGGRAAPI